jgi:hypothetical protein
VIVLLWRSGSQWGNGGDRRASASRSDGGRESGDVVGAVVPAAIDEERWRPGYSAEVGGLDVLGNLACELLLTQAAAEDVAVEAERFGEAEQVWQCQFALMGEEKVIHLPELPLCTGGFSGLGGELRLGMDVVER